MAARLLTPNRKTQMKRWPMPGVSEDVEELELGHTANGSVKFRKKV